MIIQDFVLRTDCVDGPLDLKKKNFDLRIAARIRYGTLAPLCLRHCYIGKGRSPISGNLSQALICLNPFQTSHPSRPVRHSEFTRRRRHVTKRDAELYKFSRTGSVRSQHSNPS